MPGMADVTGDSFSASLIRAAFLAQTRCDSQVRQCRQITKRANAPASQRLRDFFGRRE